MPVFLCRMRNTEAYQSIPIQLNIAIYSKEGKIWIFLLQDFVSRCFPTLC